MRTTIRGITSAFAVFLFNGATLIHAQGVSVGGKFGANFAKVVTAGASSPSIRKPAFGGFITVVPARHFALQTEFLYSPKGAQRFSFSPGSAPDFNFTEIKLTSTFTYLEFPILARLLVPLSAANRTGLHAALGPSIALKLGCTNKGRFKEFAATGQIIGEGDLDEVDCSEGLKKTDVSLVFGGGVDFAVADVGRLVL